MSSLCHRIVSIGLSAFLVPLTFAQTPVPFKVQLTQPLSTKVNQKGDKVVAQVLLPDKFRGAILEGEIKESKSSGNFNKESVLNFGFSKLHHNGRAIPIRSEVTKFYNSKGLENADEEGQIIKKRNDLGKAALMAALGAGVGAAAGGAKGAGIGAGAGLAVGLLFAKFGAKAPHISFDSGSVFELALSPRQE
jgi:hypothetical protein